LTLWLSAEEERILERIMRLEGARNEEQAVVEASRDQGAMLQVDQLAREGAATTVPGDWARSAEPAGS
jgi:hypothetical protein